MMDEIINKMDESAQKGFIVKFAKSKGGKISQAWYRSKADAQKALAMLKKNGLNGIITPGDLDDTMEEDAMDENVNEVLNPKIGDKLKHKFKNVNYDVEIVGMNTNASNLQLKIISNGPDKGRTITVQRNKVKEDAPVNSVAGGGVDLAPNAAVSQSPHMVKRKKEQGAEQEKIKNKIKKMVQNNEDNNNIVFKQILDGLDKVDTKVDELNYGKSEVKEVEEKEYKTFKDKYNA